MQHALFTALILLAIPCAQALEPAAITWQLWPKGAPDAKPHRLQEYTDACWDTRCVYQVVEPTLTLHQPAVPNGAAVIILPGGGYQALALEKEGHAIGRWLAAQGTLGAVLKYRLPNPAISRQPELAPLNDVRQALKLLHDHADQLQLNRKALGVLGFSAGSHLAGLASVVPAPKDTHKPAFALLVYGVTRPTPSNRQWLAEHLFYRPLTEQDRPFYDLVGAVSAATPPTFLAHALDDQTCAFEETIDYASALTRAGVDAEVHLFARGGHGFGAGHASNGTDQWLPLAQRWLLRFLNAHEAPES